jgi:hypothetical protein
MEEVNLADNKSKVANLDLNTPSSGFKIKPIKTADFGPQVDKNFSNVRKS